MREHLEKHRVVDYHSRWYQCILTSFLGSSDFSQSYYGHSSFQTPPGWAAPTTMSTIMAICIQPQDLSLPSAFLKKGQQRSENLTVNLQCTLRVTGLSFANIKISLSCNSFSKTDCFISVSHM